MRLHFLREPGKAARRETDNINDNIVHKNMTSEERRIGSSLLRVSAFLFTDSYVSRGSHVWQLGARLKLVSTFSSLRRLGKVPKRTTLSTSFNAGLTGIQILIFSFYAVDNSIANFYIFNAGSRDLAIKESISFLCT